MSFSFRAYNIMPLNKKLCMKCWKNKLDIEDDDKCWIFYHELWNKGMTECPSEYVDYKDIDRKITKEPPENCPYLLEYILISKRK